MADRFKTNLARRLSPLPGMRFVMISVRWRPDFRLKQQFNGEKRIFGVRGSGEGHSARMSGRGFDGDFSQAGFAGIGRIHANSCLINPAGRDIDITIRILKVISKSN
jgi:hypothetical protein